MNNKFLQSNRDIAANLLQVRSASDNYRTQKVHSLDELVSVDQTVRKIQDFRRKRQELKLPVRSITERTNTYMLLKGPREHKRPYKVYKYGYDFTRGLSEVPMTIRDSKALSLGTNNANPYYANSDWEHSRYLENQLQQYGSVNPNDQRVIQMAKSVKLTEEDCYQLSEIKRRNEEAIMNETDRQSRRLNRMRDQRESLKVKLRKTFSETLIVRPKSRIDPLKLGKLLLAQNPGKTAIQIARKHKVDRFESTDPDIQNLILEAKRELSLEPVIKIRRRVKL